MRLALPLVAVLVSSFGLISALWADDPAPKAPGLGDPGALQSVVVETGRAADAPCVLAGRDSAQQLLVSGKYATGQMRDLTAKATYAVNPQGIVAVDAAGYVTPIAEGSAEIKVVAGPGIETAVKVQVTNIAQDLPVNFANEITPVFTKYSCNSGGCHGKSGGQNGFRLSLLGFEPTEDYEYLVKEARGRRLFPAAPDRSLLLLKASAQVPHGGGQRIEIDSPAHRLLRRWIEQGMPYGNPSDPVVTHIEVLPPERVIDRALTQQLVVVAHYSDGQIRDITRMTQFDSNDTELAEVNAQGLVTTSKMTGSFAIMARFSGHVGVFRGTVPLGIKVENLPPAKNFIDELVFKRLRELGMPPSAVADDGTFQRRVTVDIAGRLPTLDEVVAFQADTDPAKRAKLIDNLLASTDYADYFATKWNSILRNKRGQNDDKTWTFAFRDWIRQSLNENKPYDQFVREVITASGDVTKNGPVGWYREVKETSSQVEDTAQLFLGLRIQCARCHHHPFEKWSQQDYYGLSAFYSQVGRKRGARQNDDRIYHKVGMAQAQNPKTGENVKPTGLGEKPLELSAEADPRVALADWLSNPKNPFFARSLANRYWKHFMGRGLVDPEDDMRVTNPASNPELLDALAQSFIDSKFDMKQLIRTICNSNVYQLTAEPNEWNAADKQNFSRHYPKRLNAEVLLDAIDQVTGSPSRFGGLPAGTRATQLPDNGFNSYFLTVFGRPESSSACECERSGDANLAQSLHLLNSNEIQGKVSAGEGVAQRLAGANDRPAEERIQEMYRLAFARNPTPDEVKVAATYIGRFKPEESKRAYEDLVWALINTKEFLFNH